jgi:hypothetical protein
MPSPRDFWNSSGFLVSTTLSLFGSGLFAAGILSQVFLPIIIAFILVLSAYDFWASSNFARRGLLKRTDFFPWSNASRVIDYVELVIFAKCFKSSLIIGHGRSPFIPIPLFFLQ